ncbi:hypothetical protein [Flammeovirga kamogawensis]|uniref:Uncharacterized protein n=1 Tax=Flammeovirga kamogawensis TaxID=373891 RepID=A0ABX8GTK7_9BACT|nr:hypothetical protein [Flammeovirga kamogawensis]MBB6460024.1 hypothetical protein [Flammeovirga kamogawensis]QWG06928.1 hypothetical protein KM029_16705 [Flammeovirga kamogawensis]TRX68749.1 hypothetical protein EO216_11695 [Flammeovirga kamogawensis]
MKKALIILSLLSLPFMTMANEVEIKTKSKTPKYKFVEGKMIKVGNFPKGHTLKIYKTPEIVGKVEYKATVNYHKTDCGHLISTRNIDKKK